MRQSIRQAHWKGFTLIELLVVISIIALLMGILLPTLNAARGTAHSVGCKSNMRQWGIAVAVYCNLNNNHLPREVIYITKPERDTDMDVWYNALPPLVGNPTYFEAYDEALGSPEEKFLSSIWYCPAAGTGHPNPFNYGMNMVINGTKSKAPNWTNQEQPHARIDRIDNLCTALFMGEPEVDRPTDSVIAGVSLNSSGAPIDNEKFGEYRHGQSANFLFMDSHVSAFDVQSADTLVNNPGWFKTNDCAWQSANGEIVWGVFTTWK